MSKCTVVQMTWKGGLKLGLGILFGAPCIHNILRCLIPLWLRDKGYVVQKVDQQREMGWNGFPR